MTDSSMKKPQVEKRFYTFQEACEILDVNPRTLRKAIDEGRVPALDIGEKTTRIPMDGLEDLWAKLKKD